MSCSSSRRVRSFDSRSITVYHSIISASSSLRNLGIILRSDLSVVDLIAPFHVAAITTKDDFVLFGHHCLIGLCEMLYPHLFCHDLTIATCCTPVLQSTLSGAIKSSFILPPEWLQVAHVSAPLVAISVMCYTGYRSLSESTLSWPHLLLRRQSSVSN